MLGTLRQDLLTVIRLTYHGYTHCGLQHGVDARLAILGVADHLVRHRVEMPADLVLPAALDERGTEQREAAAAVGAQPGERGMFPSYQPYVPYLSPLRCAAW